MHTARAFLRAATSPKVDSAASRIVRSHSGRVDSPRSFVGREIRPSRGARPHVVCVWTGRGSGEPSRRRTNASRRSAKKVSSRRRRRGEDEKRCDTRIGPSALINVFTRGIHGAEALFPKDVRARKTGSAVVSEDWPRPSVLERSARPASTKRCASQGGSRRRRRRRTRETREKRRKTKNENRARVVGVPTCDSRVPFGSGPRSSPAPSSRVARHRAASHRTTAPSHPAATSVGLVGCQLQSRTTVCLRRRPTDSSSAAR